MFANTLAIINFIWYALLPKWPKKQLIQSCQMLFYLHEILLTFMKQDNE